LCDTQHFESPLQLTGVKCYSKQF